MSRKRLQKGTMFIYLIIVIFIFSIIMLPILDIIARQIRALRTVNEREEALQIAEAGINYYQWHLSHFPNDYQDGTGHGGPYLHDYIDSDTQQSTGKFSLVITPPPTGSTVVTIQSTGWTNSSPTITRTITVKYGIPSLVKYAFLSNYPAWIYASDNIRGEFMCNNGIRFEGTTNSGVKSAKETYICSTGYCGTTGTKPGIWADNPQSQDRWSFPVPAVDFSTLTSTLADMKTLADTNGIYLPPSNKQGYSLVFNSDATVTIYTVKKLKSEPDGFYYVYNSPTTHGSTDYGSGGSDRILLSGYNHHALPSNGIIYAEDNVWVEGTVRGRITVAAALLPYTTLSAAKSIYIPNNIVYSAKDGSDVLGLIAQRDIIYSYWAPVDLEVDGAQVTQYGSTQALYYGNANYHVGTTYQPSYYPTLKHTITTYGSIMSYDMWGWTWSNSDGSILQSGFASTINNYDNNLLYAPPPSFPVISGSYQQLDWASN